MGSIDATEMLGAGTSVDAAVLDGALEMGEGALLEEQRHAGIVARTAATIMSLTSAEVTA